MIDSAHWPVILYRTFASFFVLVPAREQQQLHLQVLIFPNDCQDQNPQAITACACPAKSIHRYAYHIAYPWRSCSHSHQPPAVIREHGVQHLPSIWNAVIQHAWSPNKGMIHLVSLLILNCNVFSLLKELTHRAYCLPKFVSVSAFFFLLLLYSNNFRTCIFLLTVGTEDLSCFIEGFVLWIYASCTIPRINQWFGHYAIVVVRPH